MLLGVLPGVLPAGAGRSRRGDQTLEHSCCFGLHAGEDMLVGVDGERRVGVSEPFRDDLDRYPGFDEQRAMSVTDVMEPDPGNTGPFHNPCECL